jgi:hypothetical protein
MMELVRRYWLVAFGFGATAYVALYLRQQLERVDAPFSFTPAPLLFAAAAQLAFWLLASTLWRRLVACTAARPMGLWDSFAQLCLVNLGKYLPGKLWGAVARGTHMRQRHGIATTAIVQATFLELFFQLASAVVVVAALGAALFPTTWVAAVAVPVTLAILAGSWVSPRLMAWSGKTYARMSGGSWSPAEGLRLSAAGYLGFLAGYVAIWSLLGLTYYGVYLAVSPGAGSLTLVAATIQATTAGFALGFLALFAPAGVGVRETASASLLGVFLPMADAVMLTLLFRLWTVALEGVCGGLVVVLVRPSGLRRTGLDQQPASEQSSDPRHPH